MNESEKPRTPEWPEDETQCPCGKPAGPDFRYGLCDECANKTPASALLRWGMTRGSIERRVHAALAARDATWREALAAWGVHAQVRLPQRVTMCELCAPLRALLQPTEG